MHIITLVLSFTPVFWNLFLTTKTKHFSNNFIKVNIIGSLVHWWASPPLSTMPTLKTSDFKEIFLRPTRTCPECEEAELEITENPNIFKCNFCGAQWQRLAPLATKNGKLRNIPKKLQALLKQEES
ncbi:MAG: hypothetical protein ABIC95_00885 [archaeon]